jgi:hypothetical protein
MSGYPLRNSLALLTGVAAAVGAQTPAPRAAANSRVRLEAITLLQDSDSSPFLDTARVRLVEDALRTIRRQLPRLAGISTGPDRTFLVLRAADSVAGVFVARSGAQRPAGADRDLWSTRVNRVGIPAIDSLNRVFDVARVDARYDGGPTALALYFRRPMNIQVVAKKYARVPQVGLAMPEFYAGDGSWIELIEKGRHLHFVFARGGGDCPAGCTEWDYYYVTYDTAARSVVLERQLLEGTEWSEPIFPWDVPERRGYLTDRYPKVDSVYAELRDRRWWYRTHALHILETLLSKGSGPRRSDGDASAAHFIVLKKAALARKRESYRALIDRLDDGDPDVARLALIYLRELTGQAFPGGSTGTSQWRRWVAAVP